jgi:hypothetical protein
LWENAAINSNPEQSSAEDILSLLAARANQMADAAVERESRAWTTYMRLGRAAVTVGLILLLAAVAVPLILDTREAETVTAVVLAGAVALAWISATVLLWQAGRARARLISFMRAARDEERTHRAIQLVQQIADNAVRGNVLASLAVYLAGANADLDSWRRPAEIESEFRLPRQSED